LSPSPSCTQRGIALYLFPNNRRAKWQKGLVVKQGADLPAR